MVFIFTLDPDCNMGLWPLVLSDFELVRARYQTMLQEIWLQLRLNEQYQRVTALVELTLLNINVIKQIQRKFSKNKNIHERNKQREKQANHICISWHKMNMCTLSKQEHNGYSLAGESSYAIHNPLFEIMFQWRIGGWVNQTGILFGAL